MEGNSDLKSARYRSHTLTLRQGFNPDQIVSISQSPKLKIH